MLTKVKSCAIFGLEGAVIEVEVDISPGLPRFNIVGLPDAAVQEARERVRAAIRNSGCEFPMRRITVNLAPADMKKEGPSYDLPIAIGILACSGQLEEQSNSALYLGELSLDGTTRHTKGILPMAAMARDAGFDNVFLPNENAKEGALVEGITVMPVSSLAELVSHLRGDSAIEPCPADKLILAKDSYPYVGPDLSHVKGQENAKRAMEVAAAGMHNLMMTGPPGSGKTLLARTMPSVLPAMDPQEALEATKVYSISGLLPSDQPLIRQRPFRSPHYTTSHVGLVGGGRTPRPGEITLAHRGVLFLDELPEFGHNALESLRQPLEDHVVTISRAQWNVTFPCNFMLLAAMNPCPVRFLRRRQEGVSLQPQHGVEVPTSHQRAAHGQDGHVCGGARRGVRKADGRRGWRDIGAGAGPGGAGAGGAGPPLRGDVLHHKLGDGSGGGLGLLPGGTGLSGSCCKRL